MSGPARRLFAPFGLGIRMKLDRDKKQTQRWTGELQKMRGWASSSTIQPDRQTSLPRGEKENKNKMCNGECSALPPPPGTDLGKTTLRKKMTICFSLLIGIPGGR